MGICGALDKSTLKKPVGNYLEKICSPIRK